VNPVVLGAARGDDHDGRPDPLAARLLDHLPAVEPRKHQVEHADVRALVAEAGESGFPVRDADGIEPGGVQVARHPLGDDVVVLDDQDLRHPPTMVVPRSRRRGRRLVNEWYPCGERSERGLPAPFA
jgi:hypothetical protein